MLVEEHLADEDRQLYPSTWEGTKATISPQGVWNAFCLRKDRGSAN